ncbi:MAG: hypothetical protein HQK98_03520 [Nitrospirae bacterium]|nr:hypothetical protein [Nitrospirota bacterium]
MKKKNGKEKRIGFDPTIYDYLDKVSINGWITAFLSRNDIFQRDYDKLMSIENNFAEINDRLFNLLNQVIETDSVSSDSERKDINNQYNKAFTELRETNIKIYKDYGVRIIRGMPKIINGIRLIDVISQNTVTAYRVFRNKVSQDEINDYFCNMLRKYPTEVHLCGYNYHEPSIGIENLRPTTIFHTLFPEYTYELTPEQIEATKYDITINNTKPIREFPPERDSLILRIDLNLSKKEIKRQVDEYLDIHFIGKDTRGRLKEWKYYLMVYDLYKAGHRYAEICEILISTLPKLSKEELDKFTQERNIEYYHKNALALINGDYKKYI